MDDIRTSLSHEAHQELYSNDDKRVFTAWVNDALQSIREDVLKWNGEVSREETLSGNFKITAICDNLDIQDKMQRLLKSADH